MHLYHTVSGRAFGTVTFLLKIVKNTVSYEIIILCEERNNIYCEVEKAHSLLFEKPFVVGRK